MIIRTALLSLVVAGLAHSQQGHAAWHRDFAAARAKAKAEDKFLLVHFGGSDWNSWSITLNRDVFSKPVFLAGASKHYVLVTIDYPRRSRLPDPEAQQNARLKEQYGIDQLPVLALMDDEGHVFDLLQRTGRGPEAMLASMADKRARGLRFVAQKRAAMQLQGLDRAEAFVLALLELERPVVQRYHTELMERIVALDQDGKGGLQARYGHRLRKIREQRTAEQADRELRAMIRTEQRAGNLAAAIAKLDEMIAEREDPIWQQQAMLHKAMLLRGSRGDLDEAVRLLEQVRGLVRNSSVAKKADLALPGMRRQAERAKAQDAPGK